jgi:hypothetical protein
MTQQNETKPCVPLVPPSNDIWSTVLGCLRRYGHNSFSDSRIHNSMYLPCTRSGERNEKYQRLPFLLDIILIEVHASIES